VGAGVVAAPSRRSGSLCCELSFCCEDAIACGSASGLVTL